VGFRLKTLQKLQQRRKELVPTTVNVKVHETEAKNWRKLKIKFNAGVKIKASRLQEDNEPNKE
jgi:hypothetical protein